MRQSRTRGCNYYPEKVVIKVVFFLRSRHPDYSPAFVTFSLKMETKSKGLKEQQQHHKKLLAAMLSQDSFDSVHSPALSITEDEMEDEDDAMELLGNIKSNLLNLI